MMKIQARCQMMKIQRSYDKDIGVNIRYRYSGEMKKMDGSVITLRIHFE